MAGRMQWRIPGGNHREIHPVIVRLLTLAWAAYIFLMSTGDFGGDQSESVLAELLRVSHLGVSAGSVRILNGILRKLSHLIEYAILALLLYRSAGWRDNLRTKAHLATWCIVVSALYSCTDELHQLFVPGRKASLIDCGIDTAGAAVAMLIVYVSAVLKARREALHSPGTPVRSTARMISPDTEYTGYLRRHGAKAPRGDS